MGSITKQHISKAAEWSQPVLGTLAGILIASNIGDFWVIVAIWIFLTKDILLLIFATINKYNGFIAASIGSALLNIFGIVRWTFY